METQGTHDGIRPRRHTDLEPLATGFHPFEGQNMRSQAYVETPSTAEISPKSAMSLATPSLAQVRKYYKDHGLQTAFQADIPTMNRNHGTSEEATRRISEISPNGLVSRMENVAVATPNQGLGPRYARQPMTLAEKSREMLLNGVGGTERAKLSGLTVRRRNSLLFRPSSSSPVTGRFSVDSMHHRLREFGARYIGDAATADAFVNAVQLRRPRGVDDRRTATAQQHVVVVRAKVIPRAKERKPFLMQRRFNLYEMKAASPVRSSAAGIVGAHKPQVTRDILAKEYQGPTSPAPSSLTSISRQSTSSTASSPATPSTGRMPGMVPGSGGRRITIMPIHLNYVLQYLPVLGALMISGHIRKGDAIDLPLPHPESWQEVVSYIYTGRGIMSRGMEANILYLGGRIE